MHIYVHACAFPTQLKEIFTLNLHISIRHTSQNNQQVILNHQIGQFNRCDYVAAHTLSLVKSTAWVPVLLLLRSPDIYKPSTMATASNPHRQQSSTFARGIRIRSQRPRATPFPAAELLYLRMLFDILMRLVEYLPSNLVPDCFTGNHAYYTHRSVDNVH